MSIGILSYKNDSGIGNIAHDFEKHLNIKNFFVIDIESKPLRKDWVKDTDFISKGIPSDEDIIRWIKERNITKIFFVENPLNWNLFNIAETFNVELFAMICYDWFRPSELWNKATMIAPNDYCFKSLKSLGYNNVVRINCPIDTDYFSFKKREKVNSFLFVYGYGGLGDRKNFRVIDKIRSKIEKKVVIKSQVKLPNVIPESVKERNELYKDGDVLLYPTKYEGIGLEILEAMSCGLPVIVTNAEPMNEYIKERKLLIDVRTRRKRKIYHTITENLIDENAFLFKINAIKHKSIGDISEKMRERIEKEYAWNRLKEKYKEILKC